MRDVQQQLTAMQQIDDVLAEVAKLDIENFKGIKSDKEFFVLEEKLTCHMIKLDLIDCGSKEDEKRARKNAMCSLQQLSDILDVKASSDL